MNRPFWSLSRLAHSADCKTIEPLLSLYADAMASPAETRQVDAHLSGCPDCAVMLSLIQATHRALAARPVVAPPAGLHTRIAEAIAASGAAPISLRPARSFTVRPAYAAAASLSALGLVIGYSLLYPHAQIAVKPTPKQIDVAAVHPLPPVNIPHSSLSHGVGIKINHPPLDAFNTPVITQLNLKQVPTTRRDAPSEVSVPRDRIAREAPADHTAPLTHSAPVPVKSPTDIQPVGSQMASVDKTKHSVTHLQDRPPVMPAPQLSQGPLVAEVDKEPSRVPVNILPPIVTRQPDLQTASGTPSESTKAADLLGTVKAHINEMHSVSYVVTRQSYQVSADTMHSMDTEHFGYLDAVHSK